MKDSSMTTELDEILMSIDDSSDELCFYLDVMKDLGIQLPEYSKLEAELIWRSQRQGITKEEECALTNPLSMERVILDNQEDMVKSYLAQCNRVNTSAKLNIH